MPKLKAIDDSATYEALAKAAYAKRRVGTEKGRRTSETTGDMIDRVEEEQRVYNERGGEENAQKRIETEEQIKQRLKDMAAKRDTGGSKRMNRPARYNGS